VSRYEKAAIYPYQHDPIVNVNYFQEAWIFFIILIEIHIIYILVHKYMDSSVVYNGIQSHVYRKRVQVQMITDGVTVGSDRLDKCPCIA